MPAENKTEQKDEKKEKKDEDKVVLQVHIHCEDCERKIYDAVMYYPGVENIEIDKKGQKLTVKGKIDAKKFFEKVKKRSGGKATKILYPELKKVESKDDGKKDEKKVEKKEEKKQPADVTVVLKVHIHCNACSRQVSKEAKAIDGVYDVKIDGDKVTIKGKDLDPKKVCEKLSKRTGRHAEIVPPKKDDKKEEKKEEKKEGKKDEKEGSKDDKKDDKKGDSKEGDKKDDASKKAESIAVRAVAEYVYPPQYFSDENPNSCTII